MKPYHIETARLALSHARASNLDMRNAGSTTDFYRHWSSFLSEINTTYNQLHHAAKQGGCAQELAWTKKVEVERYADPLLCYLSVARHVKDKSATLTAGLVPRMVPEMSFDNGEGAVSFTRFGPLNGWELAPLPISSGKRTATSPEEHRGRCLRMDWGCRSWWDVLDVAMNTIKGNIDEAELRFVQS